MGYYAGRVAVVTGAASGIGRALALRLAGEGASLALVDRDAAALEEAAGRCREAGARCAAFPVDVTDREALAACAAAVSAGLGPPGLLLCAAGVIHTGSLLASDFADIDRVIGVNLTGTLNTVKVFLPGLIASGGGHVAVFSSGFGLVSAPRYSAYCASKFALRGFAGALRQEMAAQGHPVLVTCVCPGAVRTPIVRRGSFAPDTDPAATAAGFDRLARTSPGTAAAVILRGVRRGSAQVLVGADARAAAAVARAAGGAYPRLASWLISRRRPAPGRAGRPALPGRPWRPCPGASRPR